MEDRGRLKAGRQVTLKQAQNQKKRERGILADAKTKSWKGIGSGSESQWQGGKKMFQALQWNLEYLVAV